MSVEIDSLLATEVTIDNLDEVLRTASAVSPADDDEKNKVIQIFQIIRRVIADDPVKQKTAAELILEAAQKGKTGTEQKLKGLGIKESDLAKKQKHILDVAKMRETGDLIFLNYSDMEKIMKYAAITTLADGVDQNMAGLITTIALKAVSPGGNFKNCVRACELVRDQKSAHALSVDIDEVAKKTLEKCTTGTDASKLTDFFDSVDLSFTGVEAPSTENNSVVEAYLKKKLRDTLGEGNPEDLESVLKEIDTFAIYVSEGNDQKREEKRIDILTHKHKENHVSTKDDDAADKLILLMRKGVITNLSTIEDVVKHTRKGGNEPKAKELEDTYELYKAAHDTNLITSPENVTQEATIAMGVERIKTAVEKLGEKASPEAIRNFIEDLATSDKKYTYEQQKIIMSTVLDSLPPEKVNEALEGEYGYKLAKSAAEHNRAGFLRVLRMNGAKIENGTEKIEERPGLSQEEKDVNAVLNEDIDSEKIKDSRTKHKELKEYVTKEGDGAIDWYDPKAVKKLGDDEKNKIKDFLRAIRPEELKRDSGSLGLDSEGRPITVGVLATALGDKALFDELKAKGYNFADESNANYLPHLAMEHGHMDILKTMASIPGIDLTRPDEKGKTVLDKVKKKGGEELATELDSINKDARESQENGGDSPLEKILKEAQKAGTKDYGFWGMSLSKRIPDAIKKTSDQFFDSLTKSQMTMEEFSTTLMLSMLALPLDFVGQMIELTYKTTDADRLDALNERMNKLMELMANMQNSGEKLPFRERIPTPKERAFAGITSIFLAAAESSELNKSLYREMNGKLQALGPDQMEQRMAIYKDEKYQPLMDEVRNQANTDGGLQIMSNVYQVLPDGVNKDQFLATFGVDKEALPPPTIDKEGKEITPEKEDENIPQMNSEELSDYRNYQRIFNEVKQKFPPEERISVLEGIFPDKSKHEMVQLAIEIMKEDEKKNILLGLKDDDQLKYEKIKDEDKKTLGIQPPPDGKGLNWGATKLANSLAKTLGDGSSSGASGATFEIRGLDGSEPIVVTDTSGHKSVTLRETTRVLKKFNNTK